MKDAISSSLTDARQTAAEVLAAAAVELFPDALLFQGEGTAKAFFYDFVFPFAFQPEFLPLLEERMRLILKKDLAIKVLEMVPGNAAALMNHVHQPVLAEKLREMDCGLVQIVQIGAFADWCEQPILKDWEPSLAFKLVEFFPIEVGETTLLRIVGVLERDKQALKSSVKQIPSFAQKDHLHLIKELDLFTPMQDLGDGLWAWLPKADAVRSALVEWWGREHRKQNFQLMTTPSCLHVDEDDDPGFYVMRAHRDCWERRGAAATYRVAEITYMSSLQGKELKNGLFDAVAWISDRAHLFVTDEELFKECISSLQFITKIPKILGFEFQIILYTGNVGTQKKDSKGAKVYRLLQEVLKQARIDHVAIQDPMLEQESRIQIRIADALGRWWDGPFMGIDPSEKLKSGFTCVVRSAFNSLERLVALYIEKSGGRWPFCFSPEQVRILTISDDCNVYAQALKDALDKKGIRVGLDLMQDPLKARLHRALAEHIPFAVLIGNREVETNSVSYRTPNSPNNEKMGTDEFINMIIELNGSKDSEPEN